MPAEFEADLDPEYRWPRVRFHFPNGWSASLVVRIGPDRFTGMCASVAACPTGCWERGMTEIISTEASAYEAIGQLAMIADRPALKGFDWKTVGDSRARPTHYTPPARKHAADRTYDNVQRDRAIAEIHAWPVSTQRNVGDLVDQIAAALGMVRL